MKSKSNLRSLMLTVGVILGIIIIFEFAHISSRTVFMTAGQYFQEFMSLKK